MKIGGHNGQTAIGIHGRHLDLNSRVQYVAMDRQRQVLPRVTYVNDKGQKIEFVSAGAKAAPELLAAGESRSMDCMDCHNRPAHIFQMPDRAVDQAMSDGLINPDLPFIKKKATEVLKATYSDRDDAAERIASGLHDFYRTTYPDAYRDKRPEIEGAIREIQAVYLRNVFPLMRVTWGTYPNNLGHTDFPGCFRCHDGSHTAADGRTISNDCDTCHTLLAVEEPNPKVITQLGLQ
jgi:formate-dependent nitrite reductase cytochrome c552 subunit